MMGINGGRISGGEKSRMKKQWREKNRKKFGRKMGKEKEGSSPAQTWPDCGRGSAGLATEKRKKKRRLKPGGLSRAEKERPGTCRGALWNNESEIGLRLPFFVFYFLT